MATQYPGRIVKKGEANAELVGQIQAVLKAAGYACFANGVFDETMESAVRLFQAQHFDQQGHALIADGQVGPLTWARLFRVVVSAPAALPNSLASRALAVARGEIGTREVPEGSNRGPQVDLYLDSVGIPPNQGTADQRYWCAAFVYWCFRSAAKNASMTNPLPRTASALSQWTKSVSIPKCRHVTKAQALANPELILPGMIFIQDHGGGAGHTGFVERAESGRLFTIEGNIADGAAPGRNGIGVFATNRRKITDTELVGFIDYSAY
jgi:hypothetical protein